MIDVPNTKSFDVDATGLLLRGQAHTQARRTRLHNVGPVVSVTERTSGSYLYLIDHDHQVLLAFIAIEIDPVHTRMDYTYIYILHTVVQAQEEGIK